MLRISHVSIIIALLNVPRLWLRVFAILWGLPWGLPCLLQFLTSVPFTIVRYMLPG